MPNESPNIHRQPLIGQCAVIAVTLISCASSLLAQTAQAKQVDSTQANQSALNQVQILTQRVALLEQKLAKLDARLTIDESTSTNNPQAATEVTPVPGENGPNKAPSKSDEDRLDNIEKLLDQLSDSQNKVTAPFQVVDSNGFVIMEVVGGTGNDVYRGVKVNSSNGSSAFIGTGGGGYANFSVRKSGQNSPVAWLGVHSNGKPGIGILGDGTGNFTSQMIDNGGGGELQLYNPSGQVVSLIGSNPTNGEGHAKFMDAGGTPLLTLGAAGTHGDVLMFGDGKGVPVWEFMLTGFH